MKLCKQCKKCGKCKKPYSEMSNYADRCKEFEEIKQTNYDRIKAMSVEEMSAIIMCPAEMDCCFEPPINCAKYSNAIETDCDCCKCCEKYLESEVSE